MEILTLYDKDTISRVVDLLKKHLFTYIGNIDGGSCFIPYSDREVLGPPPHPVYKDWSL